MSFPAISWGWSSQTGYLVQQEQQRTIQSVPSMMHMSDRPRRFWQCRARVSAADWATIETLYANEIANEAHDPFTLTDPYRSVDYDVIFTAQPSGVVSRFGYVDIVVDLEEDAVATFTRGSAGAYPSTHQSRGSRELPGDEISLIRYPYGGVEALNRSAAPVRRLALVHDKLTTAQLATLMEHYEDNWDGTFSVDFDLTAETGLTAGYEAPPAIRQIQGRFRLTNTLWLS